MSTCPEKDLHSVYLDGEMPEEFAKQYESHLATCEKCRKELEKLKNLSSFYREDSISVKLNQVYLDQSFERLQTKMRFAKNTGYHENNKNILHSYTKWVSGFAAAAAVFALIVTPLKYSRNTEQEVNAIARTEIKPIAENKVVVDGNLDKVKISAALSSSKETKNEPGSEEAVTSTVINPNQKVVSATNLASNFSDIDVFRPDFNKSPVSVKIEVPGINKIPEEQVENFERQ